MTAARASIVGALALLFFSGCVTTEARVRVVTRAGALRDATVMPATLAPGLQIAIGAEAATDAELALLEQQLASHLGTRMATSTSTAPRVGQLAFVRVRVKATPGRQQHRYLADCRLRLSIDGAVVAEADANVARLVRARNLSLVELEQMRTEIAANAGRIPLLNSDDVNAALLSACQAAFDAVAFDIRPQDEGIDDVAGPGFSALERSLERKDQRRRLLERLNELDKPTAIPSVPAQQKLAAALVDLGGVGVLADALRVAAHLHDNNALVRRAAELTFANLCAGQEQLAPTSTACVRPAHPPSPSPLPPADVDDDDDDDDDDAVRGPPEDPETTTPPPPAPALEN